ncbi:sigma-54-dependent Fis family transcriptional regulator [Oceanirhabdus sp. W0125-5]|uniref:sigma-54-dependent Fis family transcriptional regulator n=1 Tax=Oceanirhabdus sp. W0125-5 TaxID=2999116 RepID=UPI0022F2CB45|nr:sigma 54-interacting transcriptional regulator [Oceanirhabdus sp. W0125-5]WBW99509.1 sigma 54-interacting transcriptional regulator [Oceanirhabdus sp. W0125-5]
MKSTEPKPHKQYIVQSHERCSSQGIDKGLVYSRKILSGKKLSEKLEEKKELIVIATPFMNSLYNCVKGSNFFAIITDEEGCILNVMGDKGIVDEAYKLKMVPGAYMNEENIGTNAMSLALTQKVPVQVSNNEHYLESYHKWTCSCCPIKDTKGNIIGTIDLTGYSENVHPHTLGMVVAAAKFIEKMLEINKYNEALIHNNNHIKTIFNTISKGIITLDLSGTIKTTNKIANEMFGFSQTKILEMKIWDLVEGWQEILDTLYSEKNFIDEDVYIKSKKNKLQLNVSAHPILDSEKRIQEIILVFQELKKVRKLAGRISSGHAVYTFNKIIGENQEFLKVINYCNKIANSRSTILITGESGTGKEVFAQSIHNASDRRDEPFIAVNCGAIPRSLIESELFGYEDGAFTGAKRGGCPGKFEIADGGTIFLDEIGEMSLDMQTKLLRVIEEKVINRIGGRNPIPVNVRIIAATNKNLKAEVEKGNFRNDLFYRLNVLPVYLPPLRDRKDDIPLLIEFFMNTVSKRLNKRKVEIPEEYLENLINYNWPGNIRELENVIELIINTESMPLNLEKRSIKPETDFIEIEEENLKLEYIEKKHILSVLGKFKGNVTSASKALGVGRNTLYRKLEKYNVEISSLK